MCARMCECMCVLVCRFVCRFVCVYVHKRMSVCALASRPTIRPYTTEGCHMCSNEPFPMK